MIRMCNTSKPWPMLCQRKVVGSCTFQPSVSAPLVMRLYRSVLKRSAIGPPLHGATLSKTEIKVWLVRVWEPEPPESVEALEWLLVTTVPVATQEDAWERVQWYKWRWFMEDFHKVRKSGCGIEVRRQQTVGALWNLLAILTPMAMRLLWLRQTAQQAPQTPATEVVSPSGRAGGDHVRPTSWGCIDGQ